MNHSSSFSLDLGYFLVLNTKEQWEEEEADHQQLVLQLQAVELHLTFGTSREQAPHRWFEEISLTTTTTTSSC